MVSYAADGMRERVEGLGAGIVPPITICDAEGTGTDTGTGSDGGAGSQ